MHLYRNAYPYTNLRFPITTSWSTRSVSMWVKWVAKVGGDPGAWAELYFQGSSFSSSVGIFITGCGWSVEKCNGNIWTAVGGGGFATSTRTLEDYDWHHVGVAWGGSTSYIFIDGQCLATGSTPSSYGGIIGMGAHDDMDWSQSNEHRTNARFANYRIFAEKLGREDMHELAGIDPPATELHWATQPGSGVGVFEGGVLPVQPVIHVRRAGPVLVASGYEATATVTVTVTTGTGTAFSATAAASGGIATFSGLGINLSGSSNAIKITASVTFGCGFSLTSAESDSFVVDFVATTINFVAAPTGTNSDGSAFGTQPSVEILDPRGVRIPSGPHETLNVALSLNPGTGTGTLGGGSSTVAAGGGLATFTGVLVNLGTMGTFTLTAVLPSNGGITDTSGSFTVTNLADHLALTAGPTGNFVNDGDLGTVTVELRLSGGALVGAGPDATKLVTVSATLVSGSGSLSGGGAVAGIGGIVTFTGLSITGATSGSQFKLTFSAAGLATIDGGTFTVYSRATQLVITSGALGDIMSGDTLAGAPIVAEIRDSSNVIVGAGPDSSLIVTLFVSSGTVSLAGASLTETGGSGTVSFSSALTATLLAGASSPSTILSLAATSAEGTALAAAATGAFAVDQVATQLVFVATPGHTFDGTAFTIQPSVEIRDAFGAVVASGDDAVLPVALSLSVVSGSGTLEPAGPSLTETASGGTAGTFSGLRVDLGTEGTFALVAAATGHSAVPLSVTSTNFRIDAIAAAIEVVVPPGNMYDTAALSPAPQFRIVDALGAQVTQGPDAELTVNLAVSTGTGTLTGAPLGVNAGSGAVTFSGLFLSVTSSGDHGAFQLSASASGSAGALTSATTASFDVWQQASAIVVLPASPPGVLDGDPISANITCELVDRFAATVTFGPDATGAVSLTAGAPGSGAASLGGTTSVPAVAGISILTLSDITSVTVTTPGTVTLSATGPSGATGFTAGTMDVWKKAASLTFVLAPPGAVDAVDGEDFPAAVTVTVRDGSGSVVTLGPDATAIGDAHVSVSGSSGVPRSVLSLSATGSDPSVSNASPRGAQVAISAGVAVFPLGSIRLDTSTSGSYGTAELVLNITSSDASGNTPIAVTMPIDIHAAAASIAFTSAPHLLSASDPLMFDGEDAPAPAAAVGIEVLDRYGDRVLSGPHATATLDVSLAAADVSDPAHPAGSDAPPGNGTLAPSASLSCPMSSGACPSCSPSPYRVDFADPNAPESDGDQNGRGGKFVLVASAGALPPVHSANGWVNATSPAFVVHPSPSDEASLASLADSPDGFIGDPRVVGVGEAVVVADGVTPYAGPATLTATCRQQNCTAVHAFVDGVWAASTDPSERGGGVLSPAVPLSFGWTNVTLVIVPQNTSAPNGTLVAALFMREPGTDSALSWLNDTIGAVTSFGPDTLAYSLVGRFSKVYGDLVTLFPVCRDPRCAWITVNPGAVQIASGDSTPAISLSPYDAPVAIEIRVQAENRTFPERVYTVTVTNQLPLGVNASLVSLVDSLGAVGPSSPPAQVAFDMSTYAYTAATAVPYASAVAGVSFTAHCVSCVSMTVARSGADPAPQSVPASHGVPTAPLALPAGIASTFTITVRAEDPDVPEKTYSVTIARGPKPSSDASLAFLALGRDDGGDAATGTAEMFTTFFNRSHPDPVGLSGSAVLVASTAVKVDTDTVPALFVSASCGDHSCRSASASVRTTASADGAVFETAPVSLSPASGPGSGAWLHLPGGFLDPPPSPFAAVSIVVRVLPEDKDVTTASVYEVSLTITPIARSAPRVVYVVPRSIPVAGGVEITLSGDAGFPKDAVALAAVEHTVTVAGRPCTGMFFVNATALRCTTTAFSRPGTSLVVLNVEGLPAGESGPLAYVDVVAPVPKPGSPFVTRVRPSAGPASGGFEITVTGTNLGQDASDLRAVQVGDLPCEPPVRWRSTRSVTCTAPDFSSAADSNDTAASDSAGGASVPWPPAAQRVTVSTWSGGGDGDSAASLVLIAPLPVVTAVHPRALSQLGGTTVTVSGISLGRHEADLAAVRIAGVSCASPTWESDNEVVCGAAPSLTATGKLVGESLAVSVDTVAGGRGDGTHFAPRRASVRFVPVLCDPSCPRGSYCDSEGASSGVCRCLPGLSTIPPGVDPRQSDPAGCPLPSLVLLPRTALASTALATAGEAGESGEAGNAVDAETAQLLASTGAAAAVGEDRSESELILALFEAPGDGDRVVFSLGSSDRSEVTVSPSALSLSVGDGIGAVTGIARASDASGASGASGDGGIDPSVLIRGASIDASLEGQVFAPVAVGTVTVAGVPDAVRDGNNTAKITAHAIAGSGHFVEGPTPSVTIVNVDRLPRIRDLEPTVSPLAGSRMTVFGRDFDSRVFVYVDGALVGGDGDGAGSDSSIASARSGGARTGPRMRVLSEETNDMSSVNASLAVPVSVLADGSMSVEFHVPPRGDKGYSQLKIINAVGSQTVVANRLYYSDDCPEPGMFGRGRDCVPCPEGGVCPGGYRIWPEYGYWNEGEDSGYVASCSPSLRCVGGRDSECAVGYQGRLCGECDDGYHPVGELCELCPPSEAQAMYLLAAGLLWGLLSLSVWFVREDGNLDLVVMSILAFQSVASVSSLVSHTLPSFWRRVSEVLFLFVADIRFIKGSCLSDPDRNLLFAASLSFTFAVLLPQFLGLPVVAALAKRRRGALRSAQISFRYRNRFFRACVLAAFISYYPLVRLALDNVACMRVREGDNGDGNVGTTWVRINNPAETCYDSAHMPTLVASAAILLFVAVGVPAMLTYLFKRNKEKLMHSSKIKARFDFLTAPYKVGSQLYFLMEFLTAFAVAVAMTVLAKSSVAQAAVVISVFTLRFVLAVCALRPFLAQRDVLFATSVDVANVVATAINFVTSEGHLEPEGVLLRYSVWALLVITALATVPLAACTFYHVVWVQKSKHDEGYRHVLQPHLAFEASRREAVGFLRKPPAGIIAGPDGADLGEVEIEVHRPAPGLALVRAVALHEKGRVVPGFGGANKGGLGFGASMSIPTSSSAASSLDAMAAWKAGGASEVSLADESVTGASRADSGDARNTAGASAGGAPDAGEMHPAKTDAVETDVGTMDAAETDVGTTEAYGLRDGQGTRVSSSDHRGVPATETDDDTTAAYADDGGSPWPGAQRATFTETDADTDVSSMDHDSRDGASKLKEGPDAVETETLGAQVELILPPLAPRHVASKNIPLRLEVERIDRISCVIRVLGCLPDGSVPPLDVTHSPLTFHARIEMDDDREARPRSAQREPTDGQKTFMSWIRGKIGRSGAGNDEGPSDSADDMALPVRYLRTKSQSSSIHSSISSSRSDLSQVLGVDRPDTMPPLVVGRAARSDGDSHSAFAGEDSQAYDNESDFATDAASNGPMSRSQSFLEGISALFTRSSPASEAGETQ